jgi:hypothetical protein
MPSAESACNSSRYQPLSGWRTEYSSRNGAALGVGTRDRIIAMSEHDARLAADELASRFGDFFRRSGPPRRRLR